MNFFPKLEREISLAEIRRAIYRYLIGELFNIEAQKILAVLSFGNETLLFN